MLELKNICFKRDGRNILDNVNLSIDDDKIIVITGPNGSGKSTLAKIIMGLSNPDSGKVLFNGEDITNYDIDKRANMGISFSFQQPVKFKGITVLDLIKLASKSEINHDDACKVLSSVGLCANEYLNREVNDSLSGGELKRIEIATVIVRDSKLTIFDEPEAGIDLWSFNNLINVFTNLINKNNGSTIIISHQEKIIDIADTIILMNDGRVEKIDKKHDLIDKVICDKKCPIMGGVDHE